MITIVNVKYATPGTFEYCGRYNSTYKLQSSPLANPFKLKSEDDRDEAIFQYREWLGNHIRTGDKAVRDEINRLADLAQRGELALGCWCAPLKCHCECIADYVKREVGDRNARIAIYGNADAYTPADYTLKEALQSMVVEKPKPKRRKWEKPEPTESAQDA